MNTQQTIADVKRKLDILYVSVPENETQALKREQLIREYEEILGLRNRSRNEALVEDAELRAGELS